MVKVDHFILAAPIFKAGVSKVEEVLGVAPELGGAHPEHGTVNAISALNDHIYLEVLSPDPNEAKPTKFTAQLIASLPTPAISMFAVTGVPIAEAVDLAAAAGFNVGEPKADCRKRLDGSILSWKTLQLFNSPFGLSVPFFIEWSDETHPTDNSAKVAEVESFAAIHPQADELATLYEKLGIPVSVEDGAKPSFRLALRNEHGVVNFD